MARQCLGTDAKLLGGPRERLGGTVELGLRHSLLVEVSFADDEEVASRADEVIYVPEVPEYLQPLVSVVPLQLLATAKFTLTAGDSSQKPSPLNAMSATAWGRHGF